MAFLKYVFVLASSVFAFENQDAKTEAAGIQVDGFFNAANAEGSVSADQPFSRIYGFTFLPIAKIAEKEFVGYVEGSLMVREFRESGKAINSPYLQSYGVGLGYELVKTERHKGFLYGLAGVNGDFRRLGSKDVYGDMSYLHQFVWSKTLAFGGGLDMHFYLNDYLPYPLLYLDWTVAEHTKVKIFYDTGELKQFLSANWSVSLGAQYDLFHYGMGKSETYVMDGVSGMVRLEYAAGANVFIRLSAKMPLQEGEKIQVASGSQKIAVSGFSTRLQVVYGL